jgi:D-ribulokinase
MLDLYLGLDFGTSGVRAIVIDTSRQVQWHHQYSFPSFVQVDNAEWDKAVLWKTALFEVLQGIPLTIRTRLQAVAIDGTSATVLLCDQNGDPVAEPLLYNDDRGGAVLESLDRVAPANHLVLSATSSLAKLLWWQQQPEFAQATYLLHQADWLAFLLHGQLGISDYHNSLKLGYDPLHLQYPDWLLDLDIAPLLPQVLPPGTPIAPIQPNWSELLGFPPTCQVCTGTTDSIAAFLASGASQPGDAVTSLGSTLVIKLLSRTAIEDVRYGIYSHRLGELWLVGGASNTGGAVLRTFFTDHELAALSVQIPVDQDSSLQYYPLVRPGERFPINDPTLLPQLDPRPADDRAFLHGLLTGMARIEARGYHLLQELGATPLTQVYTAGGGAKNLAWTALRSRYLQVSMLQPCHAEAAYGTACLALQSQTLS